MIKEIKYKRSFGLLKKYMDGLIMRDYDDYIVYLNGLKRIITIDHEYKNICVLYNIKINGFGDEEMYELLNVYFETDYEVIFDYD